MSEAGDSFKCHWLIWIRNEKATGKHGGSEFTASTKRPLAPIGTVGLLTDGNICALSLKGHSNMKLVEMEEQQVFGNTPSLRW